MASQANLHINDAAPEHSPFAEQWHGTLCDQPIGKCGVRRVGHIRTMLPHSQMHERITTQVAVSDEKELIKKSSC